MASSLLTVPKNSALQSWLAQVRTVFLPLAIILGIAAGALVVALDSPFYILMGLAGLVVFLLALYYINFGLIVLIFISYTRFSDVAIEFYGFPSFAKPYLVILVVSILMRWVVFNKRPVGWEYPAFLLGLLSLAGFASLIYSPVPDRVFGRLLDDIKDAIIAIVIVILMQSNQAFRRTTWTLIGIAVFLGSLSVLQYFTGSYDSAYGGFAISERHQIIGEIDDYRATGPMGDPNFFAQIMVSLTPIALERFLHERRASLRLVALWALIASILTVIFTYSRGGLLAMIVALLVVFIVYPPKRTHVPVVIFSMVVFYFFLPPNYIDRLATLTVLFEPGNTSRFEERSLRGRLSENLTALEMIKANPLFGVGLSSYNYLFPLYSKKLGLALVATEREAHNMFLEVAAETGLIGFVIFSILLTAAFRSILIARNIFLTTGKADLAGMTTGFFAGMFGYFTAAWFIHNAFPRYFYMILGIAFALGYARRNYQINSSDMEKVF